MFWLSAMMLDDDTNEDNNETLFPGEAVIETDDEAVDDGELFKMEVMLKDLIECECRASGFAPFDQRKSHAARCGEPATSSQCLGFNSFNSFKSFKSWQHISREIQEKARVVKHFKSFKSFKSMFQEGSKRF